jgi:protein-L-isoaspartate(D-aspartate) O-methyltransferase
VRAGFNLTQISVRFAAAKMQDDFLHKGLRKKLVDEIRTKGIQNQEILDAIGKVPRHLFMESSFVRFSYADKAFPIGAGQTISQPFTVAFQTQLLKVSRFDKILEIGTGSGYQAAILVELGATVYTIERQRELYLKAQSFLPSLGYKAYFFFGDGYLGIPSYAPFDKILITAAIPGIPEVLLSQLKPGGLLVAPEGEGSIQNMILIEKISDQEFRKTTHGSFAFVPMLPGKENGL